MTEFSKSIFSRRSFICLLIFGLVAVSYKALHLQAHGAASFSRGDLFFIWIPLTGCFVIGVFSLIRYQKNKGINDLIISLLPILFTFMIILLRFFEK